MTVLSSTMSLGGMTASKHGRLTRYCERYRDLVNRYIDVLWEDDSLRTGGYISKDRYSILVSDMIVRHQRAAYGEAKAMILSRRACRELEIKQREERSKKLLDKISKCSNPIKKRRMEKKLNEFYNVRLGRVRTLKKLEKPKKNDLVFKASESVSLKESKTNKFDYWFRLGGLPPRVGNTRESTLELPVKPSKHFNELNNLGHSKLSQYFVVDPTKRTLTTCFELDDTKPDPSSTAMGLDTGIIRLATLSDGTKFGEKHREYVAKRKRKLQGSKGSIRAKREHHHYINTVAKQCIKHVIASGATLLVLEELKNILKCKKGYGMSKWLVGAFHCALTTHALRDRVAVMRIWPSYTSQKCYQCGHVDKENRRGLVFSCQKCGHLDDADVNAAKNIRTLGSKYPGS